VSFIELNIERVLFRNSSWTFPLILHGRNEELEAEDVPGSLPEDGANALGLRLGSLWEKECARRKRPSLRRALFRAFGMTFARATFYILIQQCVLR
jgi:hypothetical protein